ncbi:glycosyltransferase family 4 protein [Patescibacteria group bacterium]|nr:glycosyltransferase family 4 protein [Patescibacteria group bacterium]MBU1663210.1 glycosyltransferase family 4 protein [Patescibacteria group bacterium]MBU1933768.1 glycosyltransferase family 4 protein [Patescibacteria group bacterium]MBU2007496.1 glycosyltransferase family 4 protein [Patescibacteria group bacterium]MBU2233761.1 glycosyltransferase family 4 protein [Patescibacteria group bacterium]
MKIYLIGQKGIPAKFGGVEKHVEELSTRLVKAGHEVFVYTRPNYTDKNLKKYQGVNLISLSTIPTKHLDAITHTFRACLDLIKRDVDIIHFHSIGPSFLIWLVKLLNPGIPVVFTFHTKCYEHKKWGLLAKMYLKLSEATACHLADRIIVVSPSLADYALAKYKMNATYIPNGVSLPKIVKADKIKKWGLKKDDYILTVTRLVGHKGVQYLIEAYNNLKTKKKLVIVGDGVYTDDYVKKLKAAAQTNKNIIFTDNQVGRELAELFSNAYVFVQPSESEGLSIALLEAMAYKNCALVSDIRENTDVIKNCGIAFKNKNIKSLRMKLSYLLKHPELVKKYGQSARLRVGKNYNWSELIFSTIKIYRQILTHAQPHYFFKLKLVRRIITMFML